MKRVAAAFAAAIALGFGPAAAQGPAPVVVELFTSEGCSSCPSADVFLGELAERPDVLPLAFHVDYWDYLGWTDRFASPLYTQRQRAYGAVLASPMIYTPQAVVGGSYHVVGSDRAKLDHLIDLVRAKDDQLAIELAWTPSGDLEIRIPARAYRGTATVWFVTYDMHQTSEVTAGENAGRTLHHANVVRELVAVGMWKGEPIAITIPAEGIPNYDKAMGCAVIVQPEGLGPVLGARLIEADPS